MRLLKAEGSSADVRKPDDFFETLARTDGIISDTTARSRPSEKVFRDPVSPRVQLEVRGIQTIFWDVASVLGAKTVPAIKTLPIRGMRGALVPFVTSTI